jgi:hypothetical protein
MNVSENSASIAQGLPDSPSAPAAGLDAGDKPLVVAAAVALGGIAAAFGVCLIVTDGMMPLGHAAYVSALAGSLLGAAGLLLAGVAVTVRRAAVSFRGSLAQATPSVKAGRLALREMFLPKRSAVAR